MENIDEKQQMINLMLDAIDTGVMNEQTIGKFTYYYLAVLLETVQPLENGREFYWRIKSYLENINIRKLREQNKVIVGFIANYSSSWIGDELYHLFEQSDKFEPYVFLIANHAPGQSQEQTKEEYEKNLSYFQSRHLRVVQTMDTSTGIQFTWEQIGIKPQLCIWLTPWTALFRGAFHLLNYSMDILHTYIPYGIMTADNKNGTFAYDQYNQLLHNITWKNFEESRMSVSMAEKYAFVGSKNAVYTGYPKMDDFYETDVEEDDVWNEIVCKAGNTKAKRIIYAPHHTLASDELVNFSTFASNYMYFLELAEKMQEETVWVFKPHPHLVFKAVNEGIFKDVSEWNAYLQRWRNLKNAAVVEEGMYHNLFIKSDAMILDSVSFLSEYLYVKKPLLMLSRDGQYFNDFGKELIKIHYCADGTDEKAIEKFITDVVLAGNDEKKDMRTEFFEQNLDYVKHFGKNAAANIFDQISSELEN
ncbi:MAG: hypothetical protein HFI71_05455 [Lachnospiraceae bacterium]|nr:hypothetical protein [Lachnospiraceae bacterium]